MGWLRGTQKPKKKKSISWALVFEHGTSLERKPEKPIYFRSFWLFQDVSLISKAMNGQKGGVKSSNEAPARCWEKTERVRKWKKTTRKRGMERAGTQSNQEKGKKWLREKRKIPLGMFQSTLHNPDNLHHLKLWGGWKEKGTKRILFPDVSRHTQRHDRTTFWSLNTCKWVHHPMMVKNTCQVIYNPTTCSVSYGPTMTHTRMHTHAHTLL